MTKQKKIEESHLMKIVHSAKQVLRYLHQQYLTTIPKQ